MNYAADFEYSYDFDQPHVLEVVVQGGGFAFNGTVLEKYVALSSITETSVLIEVLQIRCQREPHKFEKLLPILDRLKEVLEEAEIVLMEK